MSKRREMMDLRHLRLAIVAGCILLAAISSTAAAPAAASAATPKVDTIHRVDIRAKPAFFGLLGATPQHIGRLTDHGTFSLKSGDKDFGGLSALLVSQDGARFLAISDESHWLTGTLRYDHDRLVDVVGDEIGPLLDLDGKPLKGKAGDAEGVAGSLDGDVFVSFEGNHRIWRYPFGAKGLAAVPTAVPTPKDLQLAPSNEGLEAITLVRDQRLLAITEGYYDEHGNIHAWLIDPAGKQAEEALTFVRNPPFKVTDVRQLEDGDILTLERRYSRVTGVGFECRRFPIAAVKPGDAIAGTVIASGGMGDLAANMEGLAIRRGPNGETFLYMVSDDNFAEPLQRTLFVMFELKP